VDAIAPSDEAVAILRAISRSGFAYSRTKELAGAAGWRLIDDELDLGYVRFAIRLDHGRNDRRLLSVQVRESGRPPWAFVPLAYFEEYETERKPFDQAYRSLSERMAGIVGSPSSAGEYSYPHREGWPYSYCWWSLSDATFVLVQDEFDIQFGMDVSLWVLPEGAAVELPIRTN
jgi:hypothetical protein